MRSEGIVATSTPPPRGSFAKITNLETINHSIPVLLRNKLLNPTRFTRVLLLSLIVAMVSQFSGTNLVAHEPADGEVVRSIQIIVRDNTAHVRIAIGVNNKTLADVLKSVNAKPLSDSTDDCIAALEKSLPAYVANNISLAIDQTPISVGNRRIQQTAVHHERFVIDLQYKIKTDGKFVNLELQDNLLKAYPGPIRYAIRPRGRAVMSRTNAASVLARAKPVENKNSNEAVARTITARLKVLPKR